MIKRYETLDTNNKLIWCLRDIGHTMRRISEGKGSQRRILIILAESGVITQRELTQRLGIQPGSASEVIAKLESAGLIQRTPNEPDRRTSDIRLTPAGESEAAEARIQREARHTQMFSCLSESEKDALLALLEKINLYWSGQYSGSSEESRTENGRDAHVECRRKWGKEL